VLGDMKGRKHIPEQFFANRIQVSVSPLCWSHSMFVIASRKLGLF
jgi:GH15 family glucan-1,4-alpha-glucosidase